MLISKQSRCRWFHMIASSNGNLFRATSSLCGEFTGHWWIPSQRPMRRSFDVFFDMRLKKWLGKQSWFETPTCSWWRHCNGRHDAHVTSLHCHRTYLQSASPCMSSRELAKVMTFSSNASCAAHAVVETLLIFSVDKTRHASTSSSSETGDLYHGPLTRYAKLRVAHASGMSGTFNPPPRVNNPEMHHGTCVTRVPWCMPGSLTSGFLWSRWRKNPGNPGACTTRNFTYLVLQISWYIKIKCLKLQWIKQE